MDFDDELLNLYEGIDVDGGSSSKPKKSKGERKRKRDVADDSASDMEMSNNESDGEIEAQTSTSTSRKAARTAVSSSDEEDDEQAAEDDEDEETFPYEKLYKSREDKEELDALPELEREAELTRRGELMDARRLRLQARAMARGPTKQSTRVKSTTGVTKEKESALKAYKSTRASRSDRKLAAAKRGMGQDEDEEDDDDGEAAKQERLARRRSASGGTDSDADSADDDETREKADPADKEPATDNVLVGLLLSRKDLVKHVFKAHFEEYVKGCFIRAVVGSERDQDGKQKNKYRIFQIDSVTEGEKAYRLDHLTSKKLLNVKLAKQEFVKTINLTSDGTMWTPQELNAWKAFMSDARVKLPTLGFVKKKTREMRKLDKAGLYTEAELDELLKSKAASLKTRNPALYRATVVDKLDVARRDDKTEEIEKLEHELRVIDEKLAGREQAADPMAAINERNRLKNREEVRRAEAAASEARRKQAEQVARNLTSNTPAKIDASARVKTNVRRLHHVGSNPSSTPASQPGTPAAQATTPAAARKSPETMRVDERIAQSVTISADDLF